mgnify:CR=1 FL=1
MPSARWRRRRWKVRSIQVTIPSRSSSWVHQRWQLRTSFCSNAKNDSVAACRQPRRRDPSTRSGPNASVPRRAAASGPATAVRVDSGAIHRRWSAAAVNCTRQRVGRDLGLHPRVDRVAHDPCREHILDRAEVELAVVGVVLGDVGGPQVVGRVRGEVVVGLDRR